MVVTEARAPSVLCKKQSTGQCRARRAPIPRRPTRERTDLLFRLPRLPSRGALPTTSTAMFSIGGGPSSLIQRTCERKQDGQRGAKRQPAVGENKKARTCDASRAPHGLPTSRAAAVGRARPGRAQSWEGLRRVPQPEPPP